MCSSITRRLDLTLLVFVSFPPSYASRCIQWANTYQPYLEALLIMGLPRPSAHCQARGGGSLFSALVMKQRKDKSLVLEMLRLEWPRPTEIQHNHKCNSRIPSNDIKKSKMEKGY